MRVVLIGFMGAGKSTIGKPLADKLGFDFIEMDALVLKQSHYNSITDIFTEKGEPFFRDLETSVAKSLSKQLNVVISTGGGVPCRKENMLALKTAETLIVYLETSFEVVHARVGNDSTRPLWRDISKARELFNLRAPIYRNAADIVINSETPIDRVLTTIEAALQKRNDI
jgi:shikimate kinase